MTLRRRLEHLEALAGSEKRGEHSWHLDAYFRELESLRRERDGLAPLPYTDVDREADEHTLKEVIPQFRNSLDPMWQTPEAQAKLDAWELETARRLTEGRSRKL